MDDTDLSALTPEAARDYVLAFLTTLKQTTQQREQVDADIALWQERSRLAADRGAKDLADKATTVVGQLQAKRAVLATEENELQSTVTVLKENLKRKLMTLPRLVDTDRLLAELEMAVGEDKVAEMNTDKALNEVRAQSALDEMKKKMRGDGPA